MTPNPAPPSARDTRSATGSASGSAAPDPALVDSLRAVLDLLEGFASNDQRARYLLTCNWMCEHGAQAEMDARAALAQVRQAARHDSAHLAHTGRAAS